MFVTGHTGFKGSWLCEWLLGLGAEVWGFSLPPPTKPALFDQLRLSDRIRHHIGDVRDARTLGGALRRSRPHFVFHLAAQPIVRASYLEPVETWETNVIGTVNLLQAIRELSQPCAGVLVTTDKVYANGKARPHGEDSPLGGEDPYGASKAAAEMAIATWAGCYFSAPGSSVLASARAGNVIGGGDWAADRLLPDCVRALAAGRRIAIRNPDSIRPWQHVLDPVHGYLMLGAHLRRALRQAGHRPGTAGRGAFNFGPLPRDHRPVRDVVAEVLRHWPGRWEHRPEPAPPPEAVALHLNITKAQRELGWNPKWRFPAAIERTVAWYREATPSTAAALTRRQIAQFEADAE